MVFYLSLSEYIYYITLFFSLLQQKYSYYPANKNRFFFFIKKIGIVFISSMLYYENEIIHLQYIGTNRL